VQQPDDEVEVTDAPTNDLPLPDAVHLGEINSEPEPVLTPQPYKGTPLWRRIIALLGLAAFSVLGGIVIALSIAALVVTAAIVLQLVIS
jgi:hypothetical protein